MNPRLCKEIHSQLLPFGVTVLVLVLERLLLSREYAFGIESFTFMAGCAFMAANSFGEEFQCRTMPLLLVQPVSRTSLWWEKMRVLAVALIATFVVFLLLFPISEVNQDVSPHLVLAFIPLIAFCATPSYTLSLKNTLMGWLMSFGAPLASGMTLALLFAMISRYFPAIGLYLERFYSANTLLCVATPVALYCAICYCSGYSNFLRLQSLDSQAREIKLPARLETLLSRPLSILLPGYTSPLASLVRKELQLQRAGWILGGLVCVAAPLEAIAWSLHPTEFLTALLVLNFAVCILIIPFITAGVAIAEERNLGVTGWQMTLPLSARKQWAVKMLVVHATTLLLGVALPMLMLAVGRLMAGHPIMVIPHGPSGLGVLITIALVCLLLLNLTLFASSLCVSSFRALLLALVLITVAGTLFALAVRANFAFTPAIIPENYVHAWVFAVLLACVLWFSLFLGSIHWLSFRNFRNTSPSLSGAWRQLVMLFGGMTALGCFLCLILFLLTPA